MFEKRDLGYWARREISLTRKKATLESSLASVEGAAAAALLEADEDSETIGESPSLAGLERVTAEIRSLGAAVAGCRVHRMNAIRAERAAEVKAIRDQANGKQAELESIDAETAGLLEKLSALQEMKYGPSILSTNPAAGQFDIPKSARLRAEVGNLETRAAGIENSDVPGSGVVDLDTPADMDAVVLAALSHRSESPTAAEILAWHAACARRAEGRHTPISGHIVNRVRLVWKGGAINEQESYIFCKELATPIQGATFGGVAGFNVKAGTFHSISHPDDAVARQSIQPESKLA